jgi:hypothetical protein
MNRSKSAEGLRRMRSDVLDEASRRPSCAGLELGDHVLTGLPQKDEPGSRAVQDRSGDIGHAPPRRPRGQAASPSAPILRVPTSRGASLVTLPFHVNERPAIGAGIARSTGSRKASDNDEKPANGTLA